MSHNLCVSCVLCMVVVMVVPAGVEALAETGGNSYLLCPACVRPRNSQPRVEGGGVWPPFRRLQHLSGFYTAMLTMHGRYVSVDKVG